MARKKKVSKKKTLKKQAEVGGSGPSSTAIVGARIEPRKKVGQKRTRKRKAVKKSKVLETHTESQKNAWLTFFISIRDSRREDMRHYPTLCVGSSISLIILLFYLFVQTDNPLFTPRGYPVLAIVILILVAFGWHSFNEYKIAEKETKDYSDAIQLVMMNELLNSEDYQKLFYLLVMRKYVMQTELGNYLSQQNYLLSGFVPRDYQNRRFFRRNPSQFELLRKCYESPDEVIRTFNRSRGNESGP